MFLVGILTVVILAVQVAAHYRWTSLIVNGTNTGPYVNVRNNTIGNFPITDVSSTNITCNAGGRLARSTGTATVIAGSKIGFALDEAIFHHGVINVYMAKAPNTAFAFDGSGNVWFKIFQLPPITDGGKSISFPTDNLTQIEFQVPSTIPTGQYLVRIEHIALHLATEYQKAEFYISCAQLDIIQGGSGTPNPLVALPGYYTGKEPGILVNIYQPIVSTYMEEWGQSFTFDLQPATYVQPGPSTWIG